MLGLLVCLFFVPYLAVKHQGLVLNSAAAWGFMTGFDQSFDPPDALNKYYNRHLKGDIQLLNRFMYNVFLPFGHRFLLECLVN